MEVNQNEFVVLKTLQNNILSGIRELDTLDNLQNTLCANISESTFYQTRSLYEIGVKEVITEINISKLKDKGKLSAWLDTTRIKRQNLSLCNLSEKRDLQ